MFIFIFIWFQKGGGECENLCSLILAVRLRNYTLQDIDPGSGGSFIFLPALPLLFLSVRTSSQYYI